MWIAGENITYIKEITTQYFKIAVNFPTIYHHILHSHRIPIENPIVQEYLFEYAVCSNIERVEVAYCKQDERVALSCKFSFSAHVEMCTAVKQLNRGTLYHLRPEHPVIDAVGYVKVDGQPWLLMIQVSLSQYKQHDSKAGDLMNRVN